MLNTKRSMPLYIGLWLCLTLAQLVWSNQAWATGEYIDIAPKSVEEINLVLNAVQQRVADDPQAEVPPPIIMMLHGPEAMRFLKSHYAENQMLVDLTAKLSAYGLLDVKICETWMRGNDYENSELFPFISTVPLGARELKRLRKQEQYEEYAVGL